MLQFSKGKIVAIAMVPTIWKLDLSKLGRFCPDCRCFLTKWRPFVKISNGQISDPIWNLDHLQNNLFSPFQNMDKARFQTPYWKSLELNFKMTEITLLVWPFKHRMIHRHLNIGRVHYSDGYCSYFPPENKFWNVFWFVLPMSWQKFKDSSLDTRNQKNN